MCLHYLQSKCGSLPCTRWAALMVFTALLCLTQNISTMLAVAGVLVISRSIKLVRGNTHSRTSHIWCAFFCCKSLLKCSNGSPSLFQAAFWHSLLIQCLLMSYFPCCILHPQFQKSCTLWNKNTQEMRKTSQQTQPPRLKISLRMLAPQKNKLLGATLIWCFKSLDLKTDV